jgi:hypothetical protein
MTTADEPRRGWRELAGLVGAPLGLAAAVGGWALFTPLADTTDWQLIGATVAGVAAIALGCLALGPRTRPGVVQALAALLGVIAGLAALAGVALTVVAIIGLATQGS